MWRSRKVEMRSGQVPRLAPGRRYRDGLLAAVAGLIDVIGEARNRVLERNMAGMPGNTLIVLMLYN
jgi:hypothetical protein